MDKQLNIHSNILTFLFNLLSYYIMNNIINDILNCKTFDIEVLNDINMLPSDERLKVLIAYNQMTIYYNDLLFTLVNS